MNIQIELGNWIDSNNVYRSAVFLLLKNLLIFPHFSSQLMEFHYDYSVPHFDFWGGQHRGITQQQVCHWNNFNNRKLLVFNKTKKQK